MTNGKHGNILLLCTGIAVAAFTLLYDYVVKGESTMTLGPRSTPVLVVGVLAAGIAIGMRTGWQRQRDNSRDQGAPDPES